MIIGIVAIDKNFAIGKDGRLPWHYSSDLKHFKATTTGHVIVMGSNTWASLGRELPNRLNVVFSRSKQLRLPDGVLQLSTKEEILDLARTLSPKDVFIIGGAQTYDAFQSEIEKWIVTEIPIEVENADTFMPRDFLKQFELVAADDLDDGIAIKNLRRT